MRTVVHFLVGESRLDVRTGSQLARGLAGAAIKHGWLKGHNRPRSAKAAERAAWAAWRAIQAKAKGTA
jgi:hypothetical protein